MLLGLAAVLILTGCLEIEETIVIEPDGSGTQSIRMNIPSKVLAAMQKSSSAAQPVEAGPVNLKNIYQRKHAEQEFIEAGLSLVRHKVTPKRSGDILEIEVGFDSLTELGGSPLGGGRAEWILKPWGDGKTAVFFYPMGKKAYQEISLRIEQFKKQATAPRMQSFFRKKKLEMVGLDIKLNLTLPGRVLERSKNLRVGKDPKTVSARVQSADIKTPEDLMRLTAPCYIVVFDSRKCTIGKPAKTATTKAATPKTAETNAAEAKTEPKR